MYTVIKKKGLQDFVGLVNKIETASFCMGGSRGTERKMRLFKEFFFVLFCVFLLSLCFCFFCLFVWKRKEKEKN